MAYYILLFIILIFRYHILKLSDGLTRDKQENIYCNIVMVIIVFLAALRSFKVGADTPSYIQDYLDLSYYDFKGLAERYRGYEGYYLTSKVFHLAGFPVQVWFGVVELLYVTSLMALFNRFSKDKLLSILGFVTIGLMSFSFAGLKQVMGMSFMMFSFINFIDKRYWYTILFTVFGYFCHPASLIFMAAFPLYYFKCSKMFIPIVVISMVTVYLYASLFLNTLVDILGNDHFADYLNQDSSYTYTTLIFYIAILFICLFNGFTQYKQQDKESAKFMLALSVIACGMQSMASYSPSLFRLSLTYCPFITLLISNCSIYNSNKSKGFVNFILIACMVFYFLYTGRNSPFLFFWEF